MPSRAKKTKPLRVLIADDHRLFAEALEAILAADERIEVVGQAGDGSEAVELGRSPGPDIVLMDAGMGGLGFTPASQGGTHVVERNLTRVTVVLTVLFFANSIALFRYLA